MTGAKMDFVINGQMVLKQPGSYLEKGKDWGRLTDLVS